MSDEFTGGPFVRCTINPADLPADHGFEVGHNHEDGHYVDLHYRVFPEDRDDIHHELGAVPIRIVLLTQIVDHSANPMDHFVPSGQHSGQTFVVPQSYLGSTPPVNLLVYGVRGDLGHYDELRERFYKLAGAVKEYAAGRHGQPSPQGSDEAAAPQDTPAGDDQYLRVRREEYLDLQAELAQQRALVPHLETMVADQRVLLHDTKVACLQLVGTRPPQGVEFDPQSTANFWTAFDGMAAQAHRIPDGEPASPANPGPVPPATSGPFIQSPPVVVV